MARELLGARLVRVVGDERMSAVIVETEAYRGSQDPASHAFRGKTRRNEVMFGPPGRAYVYFTMGVHFCLNVTAEKEGVPAAVLVRAAEPSEGVEQMKQNRGVDDVHRLTAGPGNLTKALEIRGSLNGEDLVSSDRLFLVRGTPPAEVGISARVGVSAGKERKWRFFAKGNPFVSKARPSV